MASQSPDSECAKTITKVSAKKKKPICIIVVGSSRTGKTTLVHNLVHEFYKSSLPFVINMDPVCERVPYPPNVDVRELIDYGTVTNNYTMFPTDGIVSTINLFSTMFQDILKLIENDGEDHEYIVVDTPGVGDLFLRWACGQTITQALASRYSTVIVNLIDTEACVEPDVFAANIKQAHTIMQKSGLPLIIAMNKVDVVDHNFAIEWLDDVDAFREALNSVEQNNETYSSRTLSPVFESISRNSGICGISAHTSDGIPILLELLHRT